MTHHYFTYLLTNPTQDMFFAGVTCDLSFAVASHKQGLADSFTRKHGVNQLVWYHSVGDLLDALRQKNRLMDMPNHAKSVLIELENPDWDDLMPDEGERLTA